MGVDGCNQSLDLVIEAVYRRCMSKDVFQVPQGMSPQPQAPQVCVFETPGTPPTESDTGQLIKARAEHDLRQEAWLEDILTDRAWYAYRHLSPLDRTHRFVEAYDRAAFNFVRRSTEFHDRIKQAILARGHYLKQQELLAPWLTKNTKKQAKTKYKLSPRWKAFIKARRAADKRSMIYDDYCEAAVSVALARGWPGIPFPGQLCDDRLLGKSDNNVEATIPAFVARRYAESVRFCDLPRFQAAAYAGEPDQMEYMSYIAQQIVDLYGLTPRAERAWRGYQKAGRVPGSLELKSLLSCN